jgi:hypothetical protein
MESSTVERLSSWGLSELDLPPQLVDLLDLWHWSLNYTQHPTFTSDDGSASPFLFFCDLVGFTVETFGEYSGASMPSLGALELDYLADALKAYASSPSDCDDFLKLLWHLEGRRVGGGDESVALWYIFDEFGWAGRTVATLAGFVDADSVEASDELADILDALDTLSVCVDCFVAVANGLSSVEDCSPEWASAFLAGLGRYVDKDSTLDAYGVDADARDLGFRWSPCDLCSSTLGGDRHAVTLVRLGADC